MVKDPKEDILEIIIDEDKDENIKNIVVQINEEDLSTTVLSDYSPEANIDFLLEAVGANAQELIKQGKDKDEVIDDLRDFFEQVIEAYLEDHNEDTG